MSYFDKELETYNYHLDRLLRNHKGQYVVIHGDKIWKFWDTYRDALQACYDHFGVDEKFLIRLIEPAETVHNI